MLAGVGFCTAYKILILYCTEGEVLVLCRYSDC